MYKFLLSKRRVLLLLVLLGLFAGYYSLTQLPIKLYPDIAKPEIQIRISHPSYTAVDFMDAYNSTLSNAAESVDGVESVEITSSNGRTTLRLSFDYGLSAEEKKDETKAAFDSIINSLPEESKDYAIGYYQQTVSELDIAFFSSKVDEHTLYETIKPVLNTCLRKITECENFYIFNVEELSAELTIKEDALFSYGITIDDAISAIKNGYKNSSVGSLRTRAGTLSLRVMKDINSVFDIENIKIDTIGGKTVQLKDIADVKIEYSLPWQSYRVNGNRAVMVYIEPKLEGNLSELSKQTKAALNLALTQLPDHIRYEIVLDPATFIDRSVENVVQSALIGALLAILCILLMIGDPRNTLIIGASIPLSVTFSFILSYAFGVTINLISLSGLALAVGMIVDSSIVVMENIYRYRDDEIKANGKVNNYIPLIANATKEVIPSIIGSTITSVCVFVPLSFTSALTASILGDLANTVVFTLLCSLIVAATVVPLVAFYVFRSKKTQTNISQTKKPFILIRLSNSFVKSIFKIYQKLLLTLLKRKIFSYIFIVLSIGALASSIIFLFPKITKEIIANPQSNLMVIQVSNWEIEDQEEFLTYIAPMEQDLLNNYDSKVKQVFSMVGRERWSSMIVTLDKASSLPIMIDELRKKYPDKDSWSYSFESWDPSKMPLPETFGLHIRVEGPNRAGILGLEDQIIDIIRASDLYGFVRATPQTSMSTEIAMYPRENAMEAIPSYSTQRLTSMIRYLLNGTSVITINTGEGQDEISINIRYPSGKAASLADIENYQLLYKDKAIPLKHFFDFKETSGVNQIYYIDGQETYNVYTYLKMTTPAWQQAQLQKQIQEKIAEELVIPEGYRIIYEDTQEVINSSIMSLMAALGFSILLIYLVLGIQFNSLRIPLIILVTIPFGFIGVILSLYLFKSTISLNSMLGVILLGGIVVNNAIILIDFYLRAENNFATKQEAILNAVQLRFRPILITTLTTILGMLPIAFALGDGSNIIQPLGIAVSGGLAFSTFFTLYMVPVLINLIPLKKPSSD